MTARWSAVAQILTDDSPHRERLSIAVFAGDRGDSAVMAIGNRNAKELARMVRLNAVPESYVPTDEVREARALDALLDDPDVKTALIRRMGVEDSA